MLMSICSGRRAVGFPIPCATQPDSVVKAELRLRHPRLAGAGVNQRGRRATVAEVGDHLGYYIGGILLTSRCPLIKFTR